MIEPAAAPVTTTPSAISSPARRARGLSRRSILAIAAGVTATGVMSGCSHPTVTRIRLGAARPGGQFHQFASALAAVAAEYSTIRIEPVVTEGSVSNLRLLAEREIDTALVLGDSVRFPARTTAIGRVHECYIQVAVLPGSPIRQLGDLRGRRIDVGLLGSGSAQTGDRLLRTAGLLPGSDVTVQHRPLSAAVRALEHAEVDAILWGDEVPTPFFEMPVELRLLDLAEWVTPMSRVSGYHYDKVGVPANTYPGSAAVDTVGVPTLLLAAPNLGDHVVTTIARLLLDRGDLLVPAQTMGFQFLDRRWLVGTGQVPLHSAAAAHYRAGHG